jgi:hypothetical protein
VIINGKPAYVWFLSTGQLNVQAPEDATIGNVAITVTNCKATSSPFLLAHRALAPGFLSPSNYAANGTQYMVATFQSDGAYVLNAATGACVLWRRMCPLTCKPPTGLQNFPPANPRGLPERIEALVDQLAPLRSRNIHAVNGGKSSAGFSEA